MSDRARMTRPRRSSTRALPRFFLPALMGTALACGGSPEWQAESPGDPGGLSNDSTAVARRAPLASHLALPTVGDADLAPKADALAKTLPDPDDGIRRPTDWSGDSSIPGNRRAELAEEHKGAEVREMFAEAGVSFPPAELLWRVFKDERHLEAWASSKRGEPMSLVATYEACAASGVIGPKRREGDRQVPEGFYRIEYFFPDSAFHLAAKVSYPNGSDRVLGDKQQPGSDIMIHGGCASIGCIALTDERIEELWVMGTSVLYKGETIHVHIFPSRDMDGLLADPRHAEHHAFWANIKEGFDAFDAGKRLPHVHAGLYGRYQIGR